MTEKGFDREVENLIAYVDSHDNDTELANKLREFVAKAKTVTQSVSMYVTPSCEYMSVRDFLDDDN